jgi:hypothetical protein
MVRVLDAQFHPGTGKAKWGLVGRFSAVRARGRR